MMALSRASSASTVYGYKHLAFCLIGGQHPSMDARFYAELGETMILAMFWLIHHPDLALLPLHQVLQQPSCKSTSVSLFSRS
jgi:hypothetical protein